MTKGQDKRPPTLPFALTVGVTGHRLPAIDPARRDKVEAEVASALAMIENVARKLHERLESSGAFSSDDPVFALVSPLADGADQIAATAALDHGWRLQAVLPFARDEYARDFVEEDPAQTFDSLIERASCILELPGSREREAESYLLAGRATVAHCDVLIALWDGAPPRGRGGTAEIVQLAVSSGVPVIHVGTAAQSEVGLMWSAFDPHVVTRSAFERTIRRPLDEAQLQWVMDAMLSPPSDLGEQRHLFDFRSEKPRRIRGRIEFPLLLTLTGVKRIRASNWRESACIRAIEDEWRRFASNCSDRHGVAASLDLIERAYAWSDRLASYYAQTFRSGHVFNFSLMATAALIGLSAFLFPHRQFELAVMELLVALAVIGNTIFGTRREWQRRWLDYRHLAERLRPMRSLKLLGVAAPEPPGSMTDPIPRRWIDWYAAGIWRAMGCPNGFIDQNRADNLIAAISTNEIDSQISYNEGAARQADLLDHRLGMVFNGLFIATVIVSAAVVIGMKVAPDWIGNHQNWLTLVSAGLPAIATSIFGIRSQGDFAGSAQRSQSTAQTLRSISVQLADQHGDLARSADLIEQAARAMLVDLDEWRLVLKRSELEMA